MAMFSNSKKSGSKELNTSTLHGEQAYYVVTNGNDSGDGSANHP